MKIEMHAPTNRTGVSQLMYVGDDGLPAKASASDTNTLLAVAGLAYLAGTSRGLLRLAAGAIAAGMVYTYRGR